MTDEFTKRRNTRDAEAYRLLQVHALMKLYWQSNGKHADSVGALERWATENHNDPIDPTEVLTEPEIAAILTKRR